MTKEQFIEKYGPAIKDWKLWDEFQSDLNSLFNLRTEEEVRALMDEYKRMEEKATRESSKSNLAALRNLGKWFLKENEYGF